MIEALVYILIHLAATLFVLLVHVGIFLAMAVVFGAACAVIYAFARSMAWVASKFCERRRRA